MRNNEWNTPESHPRPEPKSILEEIIREGARTVPQQALENEVTEYSERYAGQRDEEGRRFVVRNGTLPERDLVTGIGPLKIGQPRVRDRQEDEFFRSTILPRYMRRVLRAWIT